MTYVDIAVRISPRDERCYGVAAMSPEGSCESTLELPFALNDLAGVVFGVAQTVRDVTPAATEAAGPSAREFGEKLYEALFHGEVKSLLDQTTAVSRKGQGTGIRIRLSMDLRGKGMAEVASLPWELMRPRSLPPLVTSTQTLLVRSPDILQPTDPKPFRPPLRILALMSNPRGTERLNLDEERARITRNWGLLPGVKVDFGRPVVSELLRQLAEADYHVIHYMGHGGFDAATGRGALMLETENGEPHLVAGEDLGVYLKDELRLLRLVFLNACKTGATSARSGFDPFAGIATSLIQAGVPAVVAMQFPISDQAAITFADTFYQRIAQGFPVDAAVAEGRKALWGGEQSEWATPVLFLRSSDGVLFEPAEDMAAAAGTPAPQAPSTGATARTTPDDPWGAGAGAFRLFLAAPPEALRPTHRQLSSQLAAEGIAVVGAVPPPYEAQEHAAAVRTLVGRADLCVHIIGDRPGEPLDETDARRTFPLEQLRIGLEAAKSQLVLIPEHVDIESIEDPEYAAFVRTLIERPRDTGRFELVRTGRHQMKDEVLAKRRRLDEARQAATTAATSDSTVRTAFVDLHSSDLAHATDLIGYLSRRNIAPIMMPSTDNSPSEALSLFEANLSKVPLYLVVFGGVTRDWVVNRLSEALQRVLRSPGATTRIGVYLAPPVKGADQLRFPPFCDVAANMAGFDPQSVDALIERAAQ